MSKQLKYDQARYAILGMISRLNLKLGDKLPSEREMIGSMDCSMITLRKALSDLAAAGMVERVVGSGTFLRRNAEPVKTVRKILLINVNRPCEISYPPTIAREGLPGYCARFNMGFEYLSVFEFNDAVAESAVNAAGILLYGWVTPEFADSVIALNIPTVMLGNSRPIAGLPCVKLDYFQGVELICRKFYNDGLRNIALLVGTDGFYGQEEFLNAYRKITGELNIACNVSYADFSRMPEQIFAKLRELEQYDAVVLEPGTYPAMLACCRLHEYIFKPKVGISPLFRDGEDAAATLWLYMTGENTIISYFPDSFFEIGCDMIFRHIARGEKIHSLALKAILR